MRERIKKTILRIKYKERLIGDRYSIKKTTDLKISQNGRIQLGKVLLNENVFLCASENGSITIEDNVNINRNTIIVSKKQITVGSGTSIGPNVCIYDHDHVITKDGFSKKEFTTGSVTIGRNVWIAANVTILKGSVIGDNCIIGAGTVVKGNIPENHLVYNERVLHSRPLR